MRSSSCHFAGVVSLALFAAFAQPAEAQLWRNFLPSSKSAPQNTNSSPAAATAPRAPLGNVSPAAGDYSLSQNNGPWLIVAASFSGPGADKQAQALAEELRTQYRIAAYIHQMNFKFGSNNPGQGIDNYGAPTRRHYRRGEQASELSVLIGDFVSIEDPDAQQMLAKIKALEPAALKVDANQTTQTMAQVRQFEDEVMEQKGIAKKRGPMAKAFFTRNPVLPSEYFVPKGVDPFVAKMNDGVEHSLLDCPGNQTIRVATFRGKTILQTSATQRDSAPKSFWGGAKKHDDSNPLIEAAENAHLLTKELRAHGWEAYEFHDRNESIVTIGSFAAATQRLPDGREVVIPEVQKIVQTFDAGSNSPPDPLSGIGNDSMTRQRVEQQEQQIGMQLSSKQAQVVPGLNPKHAKIINGHGRSSRVERVILFDVHPEAIQAPKRSISSAYAG